MIGRHVQLVPALIGEQEVVAFCATHRALDHALVFADAVMVVHHVVAWLEILKHRYGFAGPRPRPSVGASAAGEVGFGDDR